MAQPSAVNSTTVRPPSGPPRLLRAGLGALDAVLPRLAGAVGERLFLTPPRHAPPPRERGALAAAEPFTLRAGRTRIRAWRFGEGPAVVLLHGWAGRAAQMTPLVPALRDAGLSAVLLDGPAHGGSGGRIASVPHFAGALAAVVDRVGARAAVGHSMGGAGVAYAVVVRGLALDAAVFLGAPRTPARFLSGFADALGLSAAARADVRRRLERRFGIGVEEMDLPRLVAPAETTPLLVVHDRADAEVPFDDGRAIAAAWPGARLLATEGLGHRRVLRDPGVASEVAAFVAARLARCACGRLASSRGRCAGCALSAELYDRASRGANAA